MLKNLFVLKPDSQVILDICVSVLDHKLSKKSDSMLIQFWLFTIRAVSTDNPGLPNLKKLFEKYC